ncbi:MAG: YafY family transcriptional regulator [Oscillospiraceae bacterium]|nr:YafY family transcriptional regulator [Oscillospiraceae bacterium]
MQIERLFKIVYYLLSNKNVTAQELAEYIGVSKRTIFRDIDTLSLSGIPVYAGKGNGGGIKLIDGFVLNKSVINEHEQDEILSALQGLSAVKTEKTEQVLQKLSSFFNKTSPNWVEVDFSSWGSGSEGHFSSGIKTAIFEKRIVEFDYYNSYGEKRHRRVEPIQLWFKAHSWYFKGFCLEKKGVRLYKLSRMRNLTVTDEIFSERTLLNPDENLNEGVNERYANNAVTLIMKIDPEMAYRVYDYYDEEHIIKNDDGSFTVTQREPEDNGLYSFIFSFGEYAEVLEPEHIRDIIKEKAVKISKKYIK